MEYSRAATAVVQPNISLSPPSQLAPSTRYRLAWSDTPVMSGRCKEVLSAGTFHIPCPCSHGEYDVPLLSDSQCKMCSHPHSQHEVASHATVDNTIQTLTEKDIHEQATNKRAMLSGLYHEWRGEFIGGSVDILRNLVLGEETEFGVNRYAKIIPIIQSSGTGKSRLLDEISKEFLTMYFTLRHPAEDGYPPGDPEITKILTDMGNMIITKARHNAILHARAVALLAGTLAQLREWYGVQPSSTTVQVIAKTFHDEMLPRDPSSKSDDLRSEFRITFINGLLEKAAKFIDEFANDSSWEKACGDGPEGDVNPEALTNHLLVRKHLIVPALTLIEQLEQRPKEPRKTKDGPRKTKELLLLVFDEAANLWFQPNKKKKDGTPFFVLRRILGMLKVAPLWSFFLSTQSSTEALIPSWDLENSDRIKAGELSLLQPFLAFPLDIEALKAMEHNGDVELRKPMSQFTTAGHMTMFGRPLWRAFLKAPHLLRIVAQQKLIGSKKFRPKDVNHVFATLASRLCLDVCMEGTEAIALAHQAVNSHLRIVLSIESTQTDRLGTVYNRDTRTVNNQGTGALDNRGTSFVKSNSILSAEEADTQYPCSLERMITITPSEPVVAEAVAELLCRMTNNEYHWNTSIAILANDLLSKGLVQKGTKGELFARLLCILARDFHLKATRLKAVGEGASFPYAEPFSVYDFLRSLFNKEWLQKIMDFTPTIPNTRQWENSQTASFSEIFNEGYMNFTHFTSTDVPLQGSTMSDLLHNLLRQQAALQLAFTQPVWDILIPVYFGDRYKEFDPARASAVLISVKNRTRPSPFSLQSDVRHYSEFVHTEDPILFILMDLGTKKNEVVVSGLPKAQKAPPQSQKRGPKAEKAQSKARKIKQHLFGIHVLGADANTYSPFQDSELWDASKKLLEQVIPDSQEIRRDHDDLCERNKRFNYHDWESRFPVIQRVNLEEAADELDGDAPIEEIDVPMEGIE